MNITFYLSDLHACGHIRGEVIAREINAHAPNMDIVCKTDILVSDFKRSNLMVFQRASSSAIFQKLLLAKKLGIKTIYDIDDDYLNTPKEFEKPYIYYSKPEVQEMIVKFMKAVDAITVSTLTLAKSISSYTQGIPKIIIPNVIDAETWEGAFSARMKALPEKRSITIGWMASGSHTLDAPIILDVVKRILEEHKNVNIHFIGWVGWKQFGKDMIQYADRITSDKWINVVDLPAKMMDFDIGIAPLIGNTFNRAKSNIKWLQYAALGVPTVASDIEPYSDIRQGVDGYLVPNGDKSDEVWYNVISELIHDADLRNRIGMEARSRMLAEFDVRKNWVNWANVYRKIMN